MSDNTEITCVSNEIGYGIATHKTMMKLSRTIEIELTQRMIDYNHALTEAISQRLAEEIDAIKERLDTLENKTA